MATDELRHLTQLTQLTASPSPLLLALARVALRLAAEELAEEMVEADPARVPHQPWEPFPWVAA